MSEKKSSTGRSGSEQQKPSAGRAGRDLPAAIASGVILAGAVIATVGWWHWGFVFLLAAVLCAATVELHRAMNRIDMTSAVVPICIGVVVMVIGAYAASIRTVPIPPNTFLIAALGLTTGLAMLWRLPRGARGFVGDVAASLLTDTSEARME